MTAALTLTPSVTDWFALTNQFPEYATLSGAPLKDYGYMAVMAEVSKRLGAGNLRVLEFGHMFNANLFTKFETRAEMWGFDDIGTEHYIPQGEAWEKLYKSQLVDKCPATRFVRGYLGRDMDKLPLNYFDIVCSVSVYDNIPTEFWSGVTQHAFDLVRPGGIFINTFDFPLHFKKPMIERFLDIQREAGFEVADAPPESGVDPLIESQFAVMVWYQGTEPKEGRQYKGNFGTVFTIAVKPDQA